VIAKAEGHAGEVLEGHAGEVLEGERHSGEILKGSRDGFEKPLNGQIVLFFS
jgi:hypothetical protein